MTNARGLRRGRKTGGLRRHYGPVSVFGDLCTTAKFLIQCWKRRWGGTMARRDFRQLGLADSIVQRRGKKSEWLDRLDVALDWPALETIVEGVYASREGGLAYPLLTCVKLLLLQQWYALSDEALEAAVDDRLSFRRFAGIPLSEGVPDHIGLSSSLPGSREAGAGGG